MDSTQLPPPFVARPAGLTVPGRRGIAGDLTPPALHFGLAPRFEGPVDRDSLDDAASILRINTSNPNKLAEYQRLVAPGTTLVATSIDLEEPDADALQVVAYKASRVGENILVEDASLNVAGADIGVNVRWRLDSLHELVGSPAHFLVLLAVLRHGQVDVFSGEVHGTIVPARGSSFGFDPVFQPLGRTRTLAEEKPDEVNARALAFRKFEAKQPPDFRSMPVVHWDGKFQAGH